jgi:hypothetical protein
MPRQRTGTRRAVREDEEASCRRRTSMGVVAILAVLLTGAIGTASARAGTYVMRNCDVPGQANRPMHPWEPLDNGLHSVTVVDDCAAGGGVAFTVPDSGLPVGASGIIIIKKPDGPRSQIQFVKAVLWYAARLTGTGSPINFETFLYDPHFTVTQGVSTPPPGSENLVAEQQLAPDTVYYYVGMSCGASTNPRPTEPCIAGTRAPLLIRGMEVTLREDVPPTVLEPTGSLLEDGPQSGIRTLTYSALDPESGLSKVRAFLDDTVVATHDLTARCPYADFTVCPASLDETLQVDTHRVDNGLHRLTLRVEDAAGNERLVDGGHPVEIHNEPVPTATVPFSVVAKFGGTSRTTVVAPYGHRIVVRGRLAQGAQPRGPGAVLDVLERLDRKGAREQAASHVETKVDGSFTVVVATNRPSRVVRLAYRAADGSQAVSRALKVRVRAASRLRATLDGRVVRFSGRVLSRPIAKRGKRILMQGHSPGSAWTQFRSLRTDRRGRFSGTYRLRVRRPGVVLKIRAVVPSEAGYGYVSSSSRAVTLRVR